MLSNNTDNNIFMTTNTEDITGKITYTNILETMPKQTLSTPLKNWESSKLTEWRWRFLKFNGRHTVEISYMVYNSPNRYYFTKDGKWIISKVPEVYNNYVTKEFYYYAD